MLGGFGFVPQNLSPTHGKPSCGGESRTLLTSVHNESNAEAWKSAIHAFSGSVCSSSEAAPIVVSLDAKDFRAILIKV